MRLNIFKNTEPTLADVTAQQADLPQKRQQLQRQLKAVEQQIAAAYGTNSDTDALHEQAARIERELRALAAVGQALEAERLEAFKRELLARYRAKCEQIHRDTEHALALQPRIEQLAQELTALVAEANQYRARVQASKSNLTGFGSFEVDKSPYDRVDVLPDLQGRMNAIEAEYPLIKTTLATDARAVPFKKGERND